jgi:hypothetical protein
MSIDTFANLGIYEDLPRLLIRAFGAIISPSRLELTDEDQSRIALTQDVLVATLLPDSLPGHFSQHPPTRSYRQRFWKWVIDSVESGGEEVHERIYEEYLSLLNNVKSPDNLKVTVPSESRIR